MNCPTRQLCRRKLAAQCPAWTPGTRHGYHAITLGCYEGELIRRTDPTGRSLGQFFADVARQATRPGLLYRTPCFGGPQPRGAPTPTVSIQRTAAPLRAAATPFGCNVQPVRLGNAVPQRRQGNPNSRGGLQPRRTTGS